MPDGGARDKGGRGQGDARRDQRGGGPPKRSGKPQGPKKRGGLRLARISGDDFELDHPRCVREMELDYEEGIELWKAGDSEAARDALRFALQGCGDNMWVHVALGRIALETDRDARLARGHFGYAFELAERALPQGFRGRLPNHRPANRPLYDAIDGLAACYDAIGKPGEAARLRETAARWSGARPQPPGSSPSKTP